MLPAWGGASALPSSFCSTHVTRNIPGVPRRAEARGSAEAPPHVAPTSALTHNEDGLPFATAQFLLLRVADQTCGLPAANIREIVHRAALIATPGQPPIIEGFLNLRGEAIPVIPLRRLFHLPDGPPDLYTPLIIINTGSLQAALEADEAEAVLEIRADQMRALPPEASPEQCAEAVANSGNRQILLLSCAKILYEQEKQCLAALQAAMATRLHDLTNLAG
jgi:chemotaxis signal transduction protein